MTNNAMDELIRDLVAFVDDSGDTRSLVDVLNDMGSGVYLWDDARRLEFQVAEMINDRGETVDAVLMAANTDNDMWNE